MLVFLKKDNIHPDGGVRKVTNVIYHYTCKHYDPDKKICTIYEIRPRMCRTHPVVFCGYKDCKCKEFVKSRPKWWRFGMSEKNWIKSRDNIK